MSSYSYNEYDAEGKVMRSTQTTDSQAYQFEYKYNLGGAMTWEKYPSGREITTSYDLAGRVNGVTGQKSGEANKTYTTSYTYTPHGAVASMKLGTKFEHTNFNSRLQPTQIGLGTTSTSSSLMKLDYTYGTTNNNGNIQTQTITGGGLTFNQSYTYDQVNRLLVAQENNGANWKQTF
ncbi:MAG: hypothetical protein MN733_05000, partial [Nitrososphaera sp.]|nr:hypothetical protein [Nitrososphaera sp.]